MSNTLAGVLSHKEMLLQSWEKVFQCQPASRVDHESSKRKCYSNANAANEGVLDTVKGFVHSHRGQQQAYMIDRDWLLKPISSNSVIGRMIESVRG